MEATTVLIRRNSQRNPAHSILQIKRYPFAARKATFYNAKDGLLHCERSYVANSSVSRLTLRILSSYMGNSLELRGGKTFKAYDIDLVCTYPAMTVTPEAFMSGNEKRERAVSPFNPTTLDFHHPIYAWRNQQELFRRPS